MWASTIPGITVDAERSMTAAPEGTAEALQAETRAIRLPETRMAWSRRGAAEVPSISVPARMTVTGAGLPGAWASAAPPAATSRRIELFPNLIRLFISFS